MSAESGSNELHRGLTKQEADLRASELSLSIGQSFELGAHPTRVTEKLNLNQLIMRTNDVNQQGGALTDLGEFVAYCLHKKGSGVVRLKSTAMIVTGQIVERIVITSAH